MGRELQRFSRYIVHTYHNGERHNAEFGADSLDDTMEWLRGAMAECPPGVFKGEIWDCLTYKLIFTAENFKGSSSETIRQERRRN